MESLGNGDGGRVEHAVSLRWKIRIRSAPVRFGIERFCGILCSENENVAVRPSESAKLTLDYLHNKYKHMISD